jgi:hypothetical protein
MLALDVGRLGMSLELAENRIADVAYGTAARLRMASIDMWERARNAYA